MDEKYVVFGVGGKDANRVALYGGPRGGPMSKADADLMAEFLGGFLEAAWVMPVTATAKLLGSVRRLGEHGIVGQAS